MSITANRGGYWSAAGLVWVGAGYVVALAAGFARHGLNEPIADPILALMELLTLLSAPMIVMLMAAIYERAAPERRVYALAGLAFGTLCAGTTSAVHFHRTDSFAPDERQRTRLAVPHVRS